MNQRPIVTALVAFLLSMVACDQPKAQVIVAAGCGFLWMKDCDTPEDRAACISGIWLLEQGLIQSRLDSEAHKKARRELAKAHALRDDAKWTDCRSAVQKGIDTVGNNR